MRSQSQRRLARSARVAAAREGAAEVVVRDLEQIVEGGEDRPVALVELGERVDRREEAGAADAGDVEAGREIGVDDAAADRRGARPSGPPKGRTGWTGPPSTSGREDLVRELLAALGEVGVVHASGAPRPGGAARAWPRGLLELGGGGDVAQRADAGAAEEDLGQLGGEGGGEALGERA